MRMRRTVAAFVNMAYDCSVGQRAPDEETLHTATSHYEPGTNICSIIVRENEMSLGTHLALV